MDDSHQLLTLMDNARNREVINEKLDQHYEIAETRNGNPFDTPFDACLLDSTSINTYSEQLRSVREDESPVLVPSLLLRRENEGDSQFGIDQDLVDDVVTMPADFPTLKARLDNLLEKRELSLRLRNLNHQLEAKVERKTRTIRDREEKIVMRLVSASTYRDEETGAHIQRLGMYSEIMARELGWDEDRIDNIRLAAPMHDIGKIGIPDDILKNPGSLDDEEFDIMKRHTTIGGEIIGESDVQLLQMARRIALTHHEQWDGSGYPRGLEGEEIPEVGRLVAIVDVYDALVHDRVYRDAFSESKALEIIEEDRGTHFDPKMHDLFFEVLPDLRAVRQLNPDDEVDGDEGT